MMKCGFEDKECNETCKYFNTCTRNPENNAKSITPLEVMGKIRISLASMEAEADFFHSIAESFSEVGLYDAERIMLVKEEAFRDCVGMIKEDLGMV